MSNRLNASVVAAPSLVGKLLVASPSNQDGWYAYSVSWIVHQDEQQIKAVVLNRRLPIQVATLSDGQLSLSHDAPFDKWLHHGGPNEGPVVAVHGELDLADVCSREGLCIAADHQKIVSLLKRRPQHLRLIAGYSSWDAKNLLRDMGRGLWYVIPAAPELVFASDRETWQRCVLVLGRSLIQDVTGIPKFPASPQLN